AIPVSDPIKYSEAFLGKPNEEYCSWILDSEKWGGVLNLSPSLKFRACFAVQKTVEKMGLNHDEMGSIYNSFM
ncbi:hypothetical protein Dsin_032516, partial [Dipteronia sinensis]